MTEEHRSDGVPHADFGEDRGRGSAVAMSAEISCLRVAYQAVAAVVGQPERARACLEKFAGTFGEAECESPIEWAMHFAMRECAYHACQSLAIVPQAQVCGYRVDFFVTDGYRNVVVECDGHDYHERTKEQASRDRSRDRRLQYHGHIVLRFTGAEIVRDTEACAAEVISLHNLLNLGEVARVVARLVERANDPAHAAQPPSAQEAAE